MGASEGLLTIWKRFSSFVSQHVRARVHMKQMENTRTSQLYGVVTLIPNKHIMIAIRVAMRVVK